MENHPKRRFSLRVIKRASISLIIIFLVIVAIAILSALLSIATNSLTFVYITAFSMVLIFFYSSVQTVVLCCFACNISSLEKEGAGNYFVALVDDEHSSLDEDVELSGSL